MRAHPVSKRLAVLEACDAGKGTRRVAQEHAVSESWVRRIKQLRREPSKAWRRPKRRRTPRWRAYEAQIKALMRKVPELKLHEIQAQLDAKLSLATLSRAVRELYGVRPRPRDWQDYVDRKLPEPLAHQYRLSQPHFDPGSIPMFMPSPGEIAAAIARSEPEM